ncbi:MAG: ATP-binding protein, partial [Kofleriaceae bacterium]
AAVRWYPWQARVWTGAAGDELDADQIERDLAGSRMLLFMFRTLRMEQDYWRGDHASAYARGCAAAEDLDAVLGGTCNVDFRFYLCLSAIAEAKGRNGLGDDVDRYRAELASYGRACPANFLHFSALVEGELARKRGDVSEAIRHYDIAIESAGEHGFLKVEALANELAGRFWIERGKSAFAATHMGRAHAIYEQWGARRKARELEVKCRELGVSRATDRRGSMQMSTVASTLDFATVIKASNTIATELVLDDLLVKMMDMIVENTGAQLGSIVLEADGVASVRAQAADRVVTITGVTPLATATGVCERIVTYAMRTAECVMISDATRHALFRNDPYVRTHRPRSVLCLPMVHKERVIGAVYLENNLVADAFTMERLDALGILVSQLAISIENASMFARLASYRDRLEEQVVERTRELVQANHQLREQSLARERMESELRLGQKLQAVGQLAAGVAHEINTPIQFIGNSLEFTSEAVTAMFGVIDAMRAALPEPPAAVRAVEEAADLEYLRTSVPQALERAFEGVTRVTKIVSAMKAFSHPDRHAQESTDLNAALETAVAVAVNEYRYVADVELALGELPPVVCHAGELNQVLLNLIVNAAHAIGEVVAGTSERGTIAIATRCEGEDAVITIADTGGGIPEAIRERVFDPFFTTKPVGRGTGQGLALARTAIVDRHGGTLGFGRSTTGAGTIFTIRIPIAGKQEQSA